MPLPGPNGDDGSPEMTTNNSSSESYKISRKPVATIISTTNNSSSTARASDYITTDETSVEETNPPAIDPHDRLIQENATPSPEQERYVKWGIAWKTPLLIVLWTLIGFSWAIVHHFYYQSLSGTKVGSSSRQNWAVGLGTAFTFLVIASLRVTCDTAYKQYIWTLFKRKPFALDTLNKLFSITSDPTAFLSWELFRHAKIAYFVAAVCWCMPLAGITPPATLSVVPRLWNETSRVSWASLNWNSSNFTDTRYSGAIPSFEVLQIATLAAESMAIIPLPPPPPSAANSSFHLQFFGPTLNCSLAKSSQQSVFDHYSSALANGSIMTVTRSAFESKKLAWGIQGFPFGIAPLMNVYSAFSLYSGKWGGWLGSDVSNALGPPDEFNNWYTGMQAENHTGWRFLDYEEVEGPPPYFTTQQLWIQTADQGMVCIMGNASFDVRYEFVNAAPTVAEYSISMFEPFWMPLYASEIPSISPANIASVPNSWNPFKSYMAIYLALSSLLNGNVSTTLTNSVVVNSNSYQTSVEFDGNVTLYDDSSKVLQHGLSACDEFVHGYWNGDHAIGIGPNGPAPWRQSAAGIGGGVTTGVRLGSNFTNISNDLFTKPAWMCRNQTLLKAIEDLANNITISMLSSASLVTQNATTVDMLYFRTQNIYKYDSRNLILSYSIAALFTILCAFAGFFALRYNGVTHSTAFSAIIATTRNHDLDAVLRGHSLGALPLEHTNMKVRFGELMRDGEKTWDDDGNDGEGGPTRHIGFGAATKVLSLKKGWKYI